LKYTVTAEVADADIRTALENWLTRWVIGEHLCPFASGAWRANAVSISVLRGALEVQLTALAALFAELSVAQNPLANCLVVLAEGADDFDDFLDVLDVAEQLLVSLDYSGILQIASFHPAYRFADSGALAHQSHITDFTNRSPFPCLHLLPEVAVSTALQRYPNPASIPERNKAHLTHLGDRVVQTRWAKSIAPTPVSAPKEPFAPK